MLEQRSRFVFLFMFRRNKNVESLAARPEWSSFFSLDLAWGKIAGTEGGKAAQNIFIYTFELRFRSKINFLIEILISF
ncbi:hypothetical protein SAMN05421793_1309 [Epilithonimonas hominis]|uniref:Uncharacterized protein n=2 Tax=Epilithonimonas hominis TaxID=420404 RepID=A0A1H6KWL9_9FLAO|nr:hypothetical protein SAMN05421793_1309 [Epilithonimonas hominis]